MSQELKVQIPSTDIVEMADGVHIFMDLPGVPKENLSIDLEVNELVIKAVSTYDPTPMEGARVLHSEFISENFERTFTLSDMVERDKVTATLVDGVLDLFLPRAIAMTPRKIQINAE